MRRTTNRTSLKHSMVRAVFTLYGCVYENDTSTPGVRPVVLQNEGRYNFLCCGQEMRDTGMREQNEAAPPHPPSSSFVLQNRTQ